MSERKDKTKKKGMLQTLIQKKLDDENLSLRTGAKQVGVSHSTLGRIIDGESLDLDTLIKACDWLGVSPVTILDVLTNTDDTAALLVAFLEAHPQLHSAFENLLGETLQEQLPARVLEDILQFIAFRLGRERKLWDSLVEK